MGCVNTKREKQNQDKANVQNSNINQVQKTAGSNLPNDRPAESRVKSSHHDGIEGSENRSALRDGSVAQSNLRGSERKRSAYRSYIGSEGKEAIKEKPKNNQVYGADSMAPNQNIDPNNFICLKGFQKDGNYYETRG
jgi:hypothetical protein